MITFRKTFTILGKSRYLFLNIPTVNNTYYKPKFITKLI